MLQILAAWSLKAIDSTALRIDTIHDVANGTVLPRSIHSLKDNQKRSLAFCVQTSLAFASDAKSSFNAF